MTEPVMIFFHKAVLSRHNDDDSSNNDFNRGDDGTDGGSGNVFSLEYCRSKGETSIVLFLR